MAARKPTVWYTWPIPDGEEVIAAASLATTMMKAVGATKFDQLAEAFATPSDKAAKLLNTMQLDSRIFDLLHTHQESLRLLRTDPLVNIAVCPACKTVTACVGAAPTKCHLTLGCEGKPVKSSTVTKQRLEPVTVAEPELDVAPAGTLDAETSAPSDQ